ncbi:MGH1-like glycoside hydrolase domain-containing protein [Lacipirellula sp.]|uniref:MGH1-like glycoside hydrolase domain-containing protein n=1 Tax=Lacipirellula sp. TaxID=2691419 RepID=UPI003D110142
MRSVTLHRSSAAIAALLFSLRCVPLTPAADTPSSLRNAKAAVYLAEFNVADAAPETINLIPNEEAAAWIAINASAFECPSPQIEKIYYFRWWTYRKHIHPTPHGRVLTEFLLPVSHAGPHNTISCALGHHIAEGRWLRDQALLDEYIRFWLRSGENGVPPPHFHQFSSWLASAVWDRYLVTGDRAGTIDLLDDLVADYRQWEAERQRPDGLFWQYDVRDGMEESISGGRRVENIRPTINAYMAANARAIAAIAELAGNPELAAEFTAKANSLQEKLLAALWDEEAQFFKVRRPDGSLSDAREAIGFLPFTFSLAQRKHLAAWRQLNDSEGFRAPWGLTTAEQRHPQFRTHGTGTCEWDGAVWPFATSQTLGGLANVLRGPPQPYVTRRDFLEQMETYARAHERDGKPYIGEYHDEQTGAWLITGPKAERSRHYNHSTFNDLVITGLVGLVPRADEIIEVDPLLPPDAWDWFRIESIPYHGRRLTIVWDRDGTRYHEGAGLAIWIDGREAARSPTLTRLTAQLHEEDEQR